MNVEKIAITDRASWLAMRVKDVTASDVAAICGVDPRRSPLRVYAEKMGLIPPTEESPVMRKGRWFEPAIMEALCEERPQWRVRKAQVYLRCPEDRIGATPDFVAIDPDRDGIGMVQGKVVARSVWSDAWAADGEPTAPLGYQLQTLTEAKLAGASWAVIAALVHDAYTADLHVLPVEINDAAWERVRGCVAAFWSDVAAGRQPPVTPELDRDVVKALYPQDDGAPIDLGADNELPELLEERERVLGAEKIAKARKDAIDTAIRAKLGSATIARLPGWQIKCALEKRAGYTVQPSESRVLRIKRTG